MKVLMAMSGGVDSSVAAALLKQDGHDVVGVTMRLWGGESDTGCCSVSDVDDARRVAQQIGIDHLVFNFSDDFNEQVVQPYIAAHAEGTTPNPCIECNRGLKFARLTERADALGFDAVATGHHARLVANANGDMRVHRGADDAKDQSYVVHMLAGRELQRTLFPVGNMTKAEVRKEAERLGLRTASKPDSQDVCFITSTGGRETFLGDHIPFHPAKVVDMAGKQVGEVDSVEMVTIGQRRGIGLYKTEEKRFVVDVDTANRVVVVGSDADLMRTGVALQAMVWASGEAVAGEYRVQCSAHGASLPCTAEILSDHRVQLTLHEAHRRIAPGQSAVLYDPSDSYVVAGGLVNAASAWPVSVGATA
ncbi:MAG: tRNA 2-thiouridine(34) synthase MnmA [Actinomycetes bacterium]